MNMKNRSPAYTAGLFLYPLNIGAILLISHLPTLYTIPKNSKIKTLTTSSGFFQQGLFFYLQLAFYTG